MLEGEKHIRAQPLLIHNLDSLEIHIIFPRKSILFSHENPLKGYLLNQTWHRYKGISFISSKQLITNFRLNTVEHNLRDPSVPKGVQTTPLHDTVNNWGKAILHIEHQLRWIVPPCPPLRILIATNQIAIIQPFTQH